MNKAIIEKLIAAQQHGMENCPKAGGFPYFAETLRLASVIRNI